MAWALRQRLIVIPDVGLSPIRFTEQEISVLRLAADGHANREIAAALNWPPKHAEAVLHQLNRRTGLQGRVHAVTWAIHHRLI